MDQLNQGSSSDFTNKRKRGRPCREESQAHQRVKPPVTSIDEDLIGQVVSGVVEGSFEAGYFLNVKVADTDKQLKGLVFLPDKVTPVTPTTDLFPQAKMYAREDILFRSPNQQTLPQGKKNAGNQTDDIGSSERQTDVHPMSDAIDEMNHPMDTEMKDVGGSSAEEKHDELEGQTLSLMPQFGSDDVHKKDHTLLTSEACEASKTDTTTSPKDSDAEGCTTTFVDFFPASATNRSQATGSSSTLSLELFQNETKGVGTEEEKSPADGELRGLVEKSPAASPVDDVPEELQLELGNKKMSGASAIATEANQSVSSKGGFLANLFEGREETSNKPEETNAGSESGGFPEATTQIFLCFDAEVASENPKKNTSADSGFNLPGRLPLRSYKVE
ncbi:unnamed protein product, partial [Thlaspi arvense]